MPELTESEDTLRQLLIDEQVLESRKLNQVLAAREQGWNRALRKLVGVWCGFDRDGILICDYSQKRGLNRFSLPNPSQNKDLTPTLFYRHNNGELERATLPLSDTGLLMTHEACWLQTTDPLDTPFIGLTSRLQLLPGHDLALSPRKDLLAITDRSSGQLILVGLNKNQPPIHFQVRESQSDKSINLCFSATGPHKGRLWISDQETDRLGYLDPQQSEIQWLQTNLGRLGQICISPEGTELYVLALTPMLRLIQFDVVHHRVVKEVDLPGTPASLTPGVPTDSLEYDAENALIHVLIQEHGQQHPSLCSFGLDLKLRAEIVSLPPVAGWAMVLPAQAHPVQKWAQKHLDDWIAELDFLSAEHLARLRQQARFGSILMPKISQYEIPLGHEDPSETIQLTAPPIHLPHESVDVLLELLIQGFLQETGQNLRKYPQEVQRLQKEAELIKQTLESHYVALVEIENVLGRHTLQQVFNRDVILRHLDYHLGGKQLPFKPSHSCPMCALTLKNPRECLNCGFALDDPEWIERRERQSVEACSELIPGQIIMALSHLKQIVLLDAWQQVVTELKGSKEGPVQEPVYVLALPEQTWLVCDQAQNQVYQINTQGQLITLFEHRFDQPVLASFRREGDQVQDILVLDQGANEILSFSPQGNLVQSWGVADGLRVTAPTDFQFTWVETFLITEPESPRVLEWDPLTQQTIHSWGAEHGLKRPVLARRQLNGETLIVDAGRGEILIFAAEDPTQVRNLRYWPPAGFEELVKNEPAPDRMLVLPHGDLLCLGYRYWMQIQMTLGRVRWVQPWTGKRRPPQQKKKLQARLQEDDSLKRLRILHLLKHLETNALKAVGDELEVMVCEAGETVLKANDMNGILYFILEGSVEMRSAGDQQVVLTLNVGDSFGEVPLMLSEAFAASFVTTAPSRLMQLKRSNFKKAIAKASELAPVLRELAQERKFLLTRSQSDLKQGLMDKVKSQLAIKRLQEIKLFARAEPELLQELAECLRPMAFMPAKTIFEQNHEFSSLYFISRGQVGYYLQGLRKAFFKLGPGDVFGELALINQHVQPATARSESYCQLYEMDSVAFAKILLQYPQLKDELKMIAMERMPDLEEARHQQAYAPAETDDLPQARVTQLSRVRPALAYLCSDQHESAFCVDEKGQILWQSEGKKAELSQPTRMSVGDDLIWIADTGHERVVAITRADGKYVREFNSSRLDLSQPRSVVQTLQQYLLIADSGYQRLVLVSTAGELIWQFEPPHQIVNPWYAEQTLRGTVLFADRSLHQVYEIEPRTAEIVWTYGEYESPGNLEIQLNEPSCVRRMSNGATVIVDTGNDRILLLSPVGTLMRIFEGNAEIPMTRPIHVELMPSGEMWVYLEQQDQVIRLGMGGQPVWAATLP